MSKTLKIKLTIFFSLVGLGISSYLLYIYTFGLPLPCGSNGCEIVRYSKYSKIFSISVPFYGVAFYLSLFIASLVSVFYKNRFTFPVLTLLTAAGFISSVYFTSLELFVIKAICNWCVASAIVSTVLFAINLSPRVLKNSQ